MTLQQAWRGPSCAENEENMNFTALYQSYYPMVYRQIWNRIRQREQAEDLAHDTFIKALRAWDHAPDDPEALRRWLGAIARNTTIDALRRSRLIMWSELSEDNQFATSDLQETIAVRLEVQAVLSELPISTRILLLTWVEGATFSEIATLLSISPQAAKTRLFRARQLFKRRYLAVQTQHCAEEAHTHFAPEAMRGPDPPD